MLSPSDLLSLFPAPMPQLTYCSAVGYSVPTLAWLQGPFYDYYRKYLNTEIDWAEKWECWNFTSLYCALAQKANAETLNSPAGATALALGRWDFVIDPSKPFPVPTKHSIAVAETDQGLVRIDPQNNTVWTPTPFELTCTRLNLF